LELRFSIVITYNKDLFVRFAVNVVLIMFIDSEQFLTEWRTLIAKVKLDEHKI